MIRTTRVVKPLRPGDYDKTFETRFRFDSFGRMQEIQYPDQEKVSYQYDAAGLVKSATACGGRMSARTLEALAG